MAHLRTIAVYYEHPQWFRPLFAELERRDLPHVRLDASRFQFDPTELGAAAVPGSGFGPSGATVNGNAVPRSEGTVSPLLFNRMSPSAWKRGRKDAILFTLHYLAHLQSVGVPVVNGVRAFSLETSKAIQISLLRRLGLPAPRTRVVNHPTVLPEAARGLDFPLVVKPNIGGSGAGIVRFESLDELEDAVGQNLIPPSLDGILLLQEFHPPIDDRIVRVETLEGRTLYGIRVHIAGGTGFNLCPADLCLAGRNVTPAGGVARSQVYVNGAEARSEGPVIAGCAGDALKFGLPVAAYDPPDEIRAEVERIAVAGSLDVGGIEYLVSRRDGRRYYYDINALSNFVADPVRVLGFDPTVQLVDTLERRAGAAEKERRQQGPSRGAREQAA